MPDPGFAYRCGALRFSPPADLSGFLQKKAGLSRTRLFETLSQGLLADAFLVCCGGRRVAAARCSYCNRDQSQRSNCSTATEATQGTGR